MRRPFAPVLATCLFVLPSVVGLAEEPKHDLSRTNTWRVGDIVTRSNRSTVREVLTITDAQGQVAQQSDTTTTSAWTLLEKVLEVDAEGRVTRKQVHFREWSRTQGTSKDESLQGATIEVAGRCPNRTHAFVGAEPKATLTARNWLTAAFGATGEDWEQAAAALRPKAPVALGERWAVDPDRFVHGVGSSLPLDAAAVTGEVALVAVEGKSARVRAEVTAPLRGLELMPGAPLVPFAEGGALRVVAEEVCALDGRIAATTGTDRFTFSGKATVQGMTVSIAHEGDGASTVTVGGEFPKAK